MAALLNYVDRNVLGLLATTIQKDLNISNQEYASIINFFLIAYTIANLLSGRVVDKLGVRWSLALFVAWWTVANALTGMARSLGQICGLRFMLGLGEAGCYGHFVAGHQTGLNLDDILVFKAILQFRYYLIGNWRYYSAKI